MASVEITLAGAEATSRELARLGSEAPRAMNAALNRTMTMVRTRAVRAVAADLGLPQKLVRPSMTLVRSTWSTLTATLRIRGQRIPLIRFLRGAQPRRAVHIPGRLSVWPALGTPPFVATMRSGHRGIFARRLPTRSRVGRPRGSPGLPIAQLYGPSVPDAMVRAKLDETLRAEGVDLLRANLIHEIVYRLAKSRESASPESSTEPTA